MRTVLVSSMMVLASCNAFGQDKQGLTFEVATLKPFSPTQPPQGVARRIGQSGGPGTADPGQMTWTALPLFTLLAIAYDLRPYQVIGPAWLKMERYDIAAKVPPGATREQANVMLQNLLKERLALVAHYESRESDVEELTVAKGGSKLKETDLDPNALPPVGEPDLERGPDGRLQMTAPGLLTTTSNRRGNGVIAKAQTMMQLANALGSQLGHPVIDKTGLTGKYDFTIEYTGGAGASRGGGRAGPAAATPDDGVASAPGSNLSEAVQQQLGLKLTKGKGKVDVLIIDHLEKNPTEN